MSGMTALGFLLLACGVPCTALGVVLKTWDQGNCYRIELQDEQKTNVWGPVDEDVFVKAPPGGASAL